MKRIVFLLLISSGCEDSPGPRIESVSPRWARLGDRPLLTIEGSGLRPRVRVDVSEGSAREDTGFRGTLGGLPFERVSIQSARELEATVPAGLDVGVHDLEIVTPDGVRMTIEGAFEVLGPDAGLPDGGMPDGGWPDAGEDAGPPDHVDDFDCSNGNCEGNVPGCPEGGSCPECGAYSVATSRGRWSYEDGALVQSDATDYGCDAWVTNLDLTDLDVEATITATAVGPEIPHLAGIIFRTAETCGDQNRYYLCALDYGNQDLLLAVFNGGLYEKYEQSWRARATGLEVGLENVVRASAHGGVVTCDTDLANAPITHEDATLEHGSVGFRTYYTSARFDDLKIWE